MLWPMGTAGACVTGSEVPPNRVSADRRVVGVPGCAADLEQELPQPLKDRGMDWGYCGRREGGEINDCVLPWDVVTSLCTTLDVAAAAYVQPIFLIFLNTGEKTCTNSSKILEIMTSVSLCFLGLCKSIKWSLGASIRSNKSFTFHERLLFSSHLQAVENWRDYSFQLSFYGET